MTHIVNCTNNTKLKWQMEWNSNRFKNIQRILNKCRTHWFPLDFVPFFFLSLSSCFATFYSIKYYENSITNKDVRHLFYFCIKRRKKSYMWLDLLMNCEKLYVSITLYSNNNKPENCSMKSAHCVWHKKSICIEFIAK